MATPFEYVFRLFNRLSDSELIDNLNLREKTQQILYQGARQSANAGEIFKRRFKELKELLPGQELQRPKTNPATLFDLRPTEEQQMMHDMLRRFALEVMRPQAHSTEKQELPPEDFFTQIQEMGLYLIAIPEALDGAGSVRTQISSALMAEDLAYGDMGLALAALSTLGFINALTEFGSHSQQARYLSAFVGEETTLASLALMEPRARFRPHHLSTTARPNASGFRIQGHKTLVPLHNKADVFLVFAEIPGRGPHAFLIEAETPGLRVEAEHTMGLKSAGFGALFLEDVQVSPGALLGEGEKYDHQKLLNLCKIGLCALSVGTAQAVVDYVIEYCNDRVAFGEPISHRQAVAFTIAEMATECEAMRLMTWRAASRAEQGLDALREAFLAHTQCAEKAMFIGSNGVQLLGGHGFIADHPVELWYRQLRAIAVLQGAFPV